MERKRLDVLLVERGMAASRAKAQALIRAGRVRVAGRIVTKASAKVSLTDPIEVLEPLRYVGRGGYKLEAALEAFGVNPRGWVCADVGASTGGFTDCLLQRGAARVYAIDVGRDQLHPALRADPRVVVMEGVNARYLEALTERVDLVVMDVAFISQTKLLPVVRRWVKDDGALITLVKPQFEAGPGATRSGVVRDPAVWRRALRGVVACAEGVGLGALGLIPSPVRGGDGNQEFLLYLRPGVRGDVDVDGAVAAALAL
ncbi:TlyA family RNA methyltransferase [Marinithermus hydrothermalis]|uniref:Hemolysin A n=1 Tax=Marinithermus hydrothermalis (strain DSM 14884 / JCM 11576 / T1) TaxID=869210 RepID=F2NLZ7_MARHT|nr:TlyA family RNA methyltransferase [Marinithermus hydrothermalis]AEB11254.1 hemolysin A [Marinithermus hydrothermalis DSM 14884]